MSNMTNLKPGVPSRDYSATLNNCLAAIALMLIAGVVFAPVIGNRIFPAVSVAASIK